MHAVYKNQVGNVNKEITLITVNAQLHPTLFPSVYFILNILSYIFITMMQVNK
jgi:hypothetical protein